VLLAGIQTDSQLDARLQQAGTMLRRTTAGHN
jgi:hypothetical protein